MRILPCLWLLFFFLSNTAVSQELGDTYISKWKQDQVMQFSTETSLLAPQFAKSLWGRIMNSPMQLTSYYLGGAQFTQLLKFEQERLGEKFDLKLFMDTVMKIGPMPIEELYGIFKNTIPE